MSLLSTDITKVKRLSLLEVKLTPLEAREERLELDTTETVNALIDEKKDYSKLITINPLIEDLVKGLNLVSSRTGERIKKTETKDQRKVNRPQLLLIAKKIIDKEDNYTKEEVIFRLRDEAKVNQERAERGFNLMVEAGVIEATTGGRYCLTGSTPF